jgi:cytochrome c-type biogenesis protein
MFVQSVSFSAAFVAGLLSFFSPCVLPLIPSYFSFICGCSMEDLAEDHGISIRAKVFISTALFVCGFSLVFILLGASASMLGTVLNTYKGLFRIIGGLIIILLGVHLTGLFRIRGLDIEKRIHLKKRPFQFLGAFLIGTAFAAGWSPCIGPLLGAILIIAGNQETVRQGIFLLGVYSLGLAIPFLVLSVFINYMFRFLSRLKTVLRYLNPTAGVVLIAIGLLLITDNLNLLTGYLQELL